MEAARSQIECCLLTWHGTVVSRSADGVLGQAPLTGPESLAAACRLTVESRLNAAFAQHLPLPDETLPYASGPLGSGIATRAHSRMGYHFSRYGIFLSATDDRPVIDWNREAAQSWETFLPVPVEVLAKMLSLGGADWTDLGTGEVIPRSTLIFKPRFRFGAGRFGIDLTRSYPTFFARGTGAPGSGAPRDAFLLTERDEVHALAPCRNGEAADNRVWLRFGENDAWEGAGAQVADFELQAAKQPVVPPAFAHRDDRRYFFEKSWNRRPPQIGWAPAGVQTRTHENAFMFLARSLEGVIFDPGGVRQLYGFLVSCQDLPAAVTRDGDRHYITAQALAEAPTLPGHYAAFYNGNAQNHYHWLVDGILSLYTLRKMSRESLKIVLPESISSVSNLEYVESLKLLGFGDLDVSFSSAPVVRLERVSWIRSRTDLVEDIPAEIYHEFQAATAAIVAGSARKLRVYVERNAGRSIENAAEVREFLERRGFETVRLEQIPLLEQLRLFAGADFVVGPHGAGLSNLVFSPPSARVLELIPDCQMRPFFWNISSKLGHEYGMLPCPTDDGTFNGRLRVDMAKLARLFALIEKA